jgi:hypothetical protein
MSKPPFPSVIDSTMIASWRACKRAHNLAYMEHWKPKYLSVHLHAGAAFARGLEVGRKAFFDEGRPEADAIALGMGALLEAYGDFPCPEDSPKSADRMAAAYEYAMHEYPMTGDPMKPLLLGGKHAIEFSFVEPLEYAHPESGEPILYSGRFDQIVNYAGQSFGFDDKTASSLGASWSKQWDLRSQFTAYCWGLRQAKINVDGFIVRGVAILKTKFDTQQAITYRPQWMIDQWYESVIEDLEDMVSAWDRGYWAPNFSESCNAYGGCEFRKPCLSEEPAPWLESSFERRRWDPVLRKEIIVVAGA